MLVDYHTHPIGHDDADHSKENLRKFAKSAKERGVKKLGIADHNRYHKDFKFDNIRIINEEFSEVDLLVGIEMDYTPGNEGAIFNFLNKLDLDYVIGSIHYIDDWMFDHPDYTNEYDNWNIDQLYAKYFSIINQAAGSDLFDIIGHLDLIKVFDYHPRRDVIEYAELALQTIADNNLCIEVNTNGLNKPIGKMYPSRALLEKAYDLGIPVTLSSDAHSPKRVGENLNMAKNLIKDIGYKEIAAFKDRNMKLIKI
ncbi:histidinol-phosphatase HisJ family protein [Selenihalanaerobacter shriftii]|uniref:Histidinol-phosphatase n=1 Tax=Selenihalanaerobacter shriftii TaxID=142842 RepID=A0A1T4JQ59_9FIRM|nr:histidinol-phosphatase HisJ family protein [Selenihalanaerobacter shriftii]SJZ32251.1 histidinol-phosphatase (PHP family) [Selenihalanaerobacter shriftii]